MYQHFIQINPLCCGAACMQMVYDHWGIRISQESIWNDISRPNSLWGFDCSPECMQKHFHSHGFCALDIIAICKIHRFLPWIERQLIPAIINYVVEENHYHFVLFEKTVPNGVIIQDPSSTIPSTFISYDQLQQPQVMLIEKPTKTVRCPHCKAVFPSCDTFSWLYAQHISRCAYCQEELFYVENI